MPESTLPKKFEKSPLDTPELLANSIRSNALGLTCLPKDPDALARLNTTGLPQLKKILLILDVQMKKLLTGPDVDPDHLQDWNARMRSCNDRVEKLDELTPHLCSTAWQWPTVIQSLAWIKASIDLSKATLRHNGVGIEDMHEENVEDA